MNATIPNVAGFDDVSLIVALQAGDEAAFEWLVRTYHRSLMHVALTHVHSHAVAEEVVQDTWLGVMRGIDRFKGRSSLKTWIFRILSNIAISRGVREHRCIPMAAVGGDPCSDDFWTIGQEPGPSQYKDRWRSNTEARDGIPEDRTEAHEAGAVIAHAIRNLPPAYREVIVLRDVEQHTSDETCSLLSLTKENERVRLHRARVKVRQAVHPYFQPDTSGQPRPETKRSTIRDAEKSGNRQRKDQSNGNNVETLQALGHRRRPDLAPRIGAHHQGERG